MSADDASSDAISAVENGCETSESKQEDVVSSSSDTIEKGSENPPGETVAEDHSTATPPDSTQNDNTQQREEATAPPPPKLRYDWYQTQADVYINIMIKKLKKEDVSVTFDERRVEVVITMNDGSNHELVFELAHNIVTQKSTFKVLGTKVSFFHTCCTMMCIYKCVCVCMCVGGDKNEKV